MIQAVFSLIYLLVLTIAEKQINGSSLESTAAIQEALRFNYSRASRKEVPVLYINCLENCRPPLPQLTTVLETGCSSACKGSKKFHWTISPKIPTKLISYEKKKTVLKIKPNAFSANTVATFTVATEEAGTSFTLQFGKVPRLAIHCQENCEKFNVTSPIVLTVTCEKDCDTDAESNFEWIISPYAHDKTTTGQYQSTIIIPPNSLMGGQKITAVAKKGGGSSTFVFATAGGCEMIPRRGYIDTQFVLTCTYNDSTPIEIYQITDPDTEPHALYKGPLKGNGVQLQEGKPAVVKVVIPKGNITLELSVDVRQRDDKDEIIIRTCGTREDSLPTLAKVGKSEAFIQQAILLVKDLQNNSDPEFKSHFFRHVLADVILEAYKLDSKQIMLFLENINDMENYTEIATASLLSECLKAASHKIEDISRYGGHADMERDADTLLTMVAKLIQATANSPVDPLDAGGGDYPSYGELVPNRMTQLRGMQTALDDLIHVMDIVGRMEDAEGNHVSDIRVTDLQSTTVTLPWRLPITIQTLPDENATRVEVSQLLANRLSFEGGPMYCQVAVITSNLFWWQENGNQINTEFIKVNMFTKRKNITQLGGDIDIFLKRNPWEPGVISEELGMGGPPWRVHKLTVKTNTMLLVNFKVLDNEYYAYVNFSYPNLEQVRNGQRIIRGGSKNRWLIESKDTILFVAVARTLGKPLKYELDIGETGCVHWEGDTWNWDSTNCRLGPNTTDNVTHCICRHLSLFAGTFFVPPNSVSYFTNITLRLNLHQSPLVLAVLAGAIVWWALLMVWAAGRDAKLERRRVHRLPDTVPGDSHSYLVGVTTGLWQGAGTSARVAVQLLGTKSNSRVHLMYGIGMLKEGAEDWFVAQTPKALGSIRAVRFYHDSYGFNPHW